MFFKLQTAESLQQAMDKSSKPNLSTALRFLEASSSLFHDLISNLHHEFHPVDYEDCEDWLSQTNYWGLVHLWYYSGAYKNDDA